MGEKQSTQPKMKKEKKDSSTKDDKEDRKRKRQQKKQQKQDILSKIPKVNEDGISYTKQQIRRMVKRVERGLPPVPTPQEESELKRQEAELRKEEEMELAGMLYNKEEEKGAAEEGDDQNDEEEENEDDQSDGKEESNDSEEEGEEEASDNEDEEQDKEVDEFGRTVPTKKKESDISSDQIPSKKRKMSNKPVPKDYVCQACHNKHSPKHWIYDCPDKVTVPGTNRISAKASNAPSNKKVFVSGLFFDTKPSDVKAMFQSCGKVTSCKLLTFQDTGRCKGQAFVVFDTEEGAKNALKLSGTKISSDDKVDDKKKKKEGDKKVSQNNKRELEVRVSKAQSRVFTKAMKKQTA